MHASIVARASMLGCLIVLPCTLSHAQEQVILTPEWRVLVNGSDYMTTPSLVEALQFPNDGPIFYFPNGQIAGTAPLYRLYDRATDHMDSLAPGEGGYSTEGVIGFPWTNAALGLTQVVRAYNGLDHAITKEGEVLAGYTTLEPSHVWGYQRFHNEAELINWLTAGGVTVGSNTVAGGAIWNWQWNGKEFIDHVDYGREMQTALFWDVGLLSFNPTEAGDRFSQETIPSAFRHGSPILNNHNSGSTQVTRSIPLDFNPQFFGGGAMNPVVYKDIVIGKNLTLNYNDMGSVAEYVTVVSTQNAISPIAIEIPTAYLGPDFNRFYTYDALNQIVAEVFPGNCTNLPFVYRPFSGFGGVIISDGSQQFAMGVYGRLQGAGGPVERFQVYDFTPPCDTTSKWNAVYSGSLAVGETHYKTWVVTGTLDDVTVKMRQLYLDGAS